MTTPTPLHLQLLISILKCLYPLSLISSCSHQVNAAAHPQYVFCPGRYLGEPRAVFQAHVGSPPHPSLDLYPPLLPFHFTHVSLLLFFNQLLRPPRLLRLFHLPLQSVVCVHVWECVSLPACVCHSALRSWQERDFWRRILLPRWRLISL